MKEGASSRGRRFWLGLVGAVVLAAACTPSPSPYTVFDFGDQSSTVASGNCTNCTTISRNFPDGRGNEIGMSLEIWDSGDGYMWSVTETFVKVVGGTPSFCDYPLIAVRARATLGAVTYRMDWDGNVWNGIGPTVTVGAPWRLAAHEYPTVYVESVTLDLRASPICIPI